MTVTEVEKSAHGAGDQCEGGKARPTPLLELAWRRYLACLVKYPLRTKALTAASIAALSDLIAQRIIKGTWAKHSLFRTLLFASYGLIWSGPSAHFWQRAMETAFRGKSDLGTVLKKLAIDQTLYGPTCTVMLMSYATVVLEGRPLHELPHKLSHDYWNVQRKAWRVWPLASLINYKFVPFQFRVLFLNCVALCWSTFLLWRARATHHLPPRGVIRVKAI